MDGVIDGGLKDGRMTPIFEDLFPRLCCGWSDIQCVEVQWYSTIVEVRGVMVKLLHIGGGAVHIPKIHIVLPSNGLKLA